ncbi:hypothetical protein F5Y10DRAFT_234080 [Nemania abortiva]|nr:hypothetical protein F5Y10DRAFT_234080 [Nemania abortiva]
MARMKQGPMGFWSCNGLFLVILVIGLAPGLHYPLPTFDVGEPIGVFGPVGAIPDQRCRSSSATATMKDCQVRGW